MKTKAVTVKEPKKKYDGDAWWKTMVRRKKEKRKSEQRSLTS